MNQTVYIKCEKNIRAASLDVHVSDLAAVFCEDKHLEAKIKAIRVLKLPDESSKRYVVSVIKLIQLITRACPGITVENEGESDVIVEFHKKRPEGKGLDYIKMVLVCLITLVGGAFAIMAYNNDISSAELFQNIYTMVLGEGRNGFYTLEISYSIGLAIGIVVFYGHFGNWKFGKDPTPLEIQMRLYEDDIDTAIIKQSGREDVEVDVD